MDLRQLNARISVAPQIEPADMAALAAAGFTTILDNRPDEEVGPDLSSDRMAAAAVAAGLRFHYLPVQPGGITPDLVETFARLAEDSPGAVLAYCRSGTRSATVWALGQTGRMPADDILRTGAEAGYDLSGIASYLR